MLGQRDGQDTMQGEGAQLIVYWRLLLNLSKLMVSNLALGGIVLGGPFAGTDFLGCPCDATEATPHASASATRKQQPADSC